MQTVIETAAFLRDVRHTGMGDAEREEIVLAIARTPALGDVMQGTGGARKVRFAGRSKGKSGGFRIVTYYAGREVPVFLLAVISKGERANLSKAEQNTLHAELSNIKREYLAGMAKKVRSTRRRRI